MKHVLLALALCVGSVLAGEAKPVTRNYLAELKSTDEKVRAEAALLLKSDPQAAATLLRVLKEDESDEVKLWAAFSLGELKDKGAVAGLLTILKAVPETPTRTYFVAGKKGANRGDIVRRNVCWALGEIGDPKAVEALLKEVRDGKDWEVRYYSALSLGKIGDPRALPVLGDVAKNDPYKREWEKTYIVREQAKKAIAKIGKK